MNRILFGLLTATLFAASANEPPKPILEYHYGNQVAHSYLSITEDGTVYHKELKCCPPVPKPISAKPLTKAQLKDLVTAIDDCKKGTVDKVKGQPTLEGSSAGILVAHPLATTPTVIRIIERSESGGNDEVQSNRAGGTAKILDLVDSIVSEKMYR